MVCTEEKASNPYYIEQRATPKASNVLKHKVFKSFQSSGDERIKHTHADTQIHIDFFFCSSWTFLHQFLFLVISWPHPQACGILVPPSGIKPVLPAVQAESYPLYHQGSLTNTHWCDKKNKGKLSFMMILMRILDHQTTFQLSEFYSQVDRAFLLFLHDSVLIQGITLALITFFHKSAQPSEIFSLLGTVFLSS